MQEIQEMGFNHWVGKISWRRAWQPTPLFLLGDPMDRRACWATVHGVQRVRHNWSDWTHTLNLRHPSMFFELWCWWRLLRVPWTAKRSNQSILKEINSEYSLEGLMLKLQYFDHLMQKEDSLENTDAGKDWGQEEKGTIEDVIFRWHHQLNGHESE